MSKISFMLLLVISFVSYSQKNVLPTYFGIQIRPLFPTDAGGQELSYLTKDNYEVHFQQHLGYSFGGIIRKGITKLIAFETGINFIQRNYNISMSLMDTNVKASHKWSHINYEIPLNALIYIQLSSKTYMNSSLGGTIRFTPTDIKKIIQTGGIHSFESYGLYKTKIAASINGNIGFEYRTNKNGFYYIGSSISIPLSPIMDYFSIHSIQSNTSKTLLSGEIQGRYLSLDFRYFFPNVKKKGIQPNKELN
jgi:hypothetical protein